ncbi:hypothetical protein HKX48_004783 [Thoreauomyces humboldtii]|nr:hypothetical protein HKX48_004783 [Thoreauomyces humboldtii]
MTSQTVELRQLCRLQEDECEVLDREKRRAHEELEDMKGRIDALIGEKKGVEARLEEMRGENQRLDDAIKEGETSARQLGSLTVA